MNWLDQYTELHRNIYGTFSPGNYTSGSNSGFENLNLLPITMKVASQTLGHDLVSVKPLNMPAGKLSYMNMNSIADNRKKVIEELLKLC